MGGDHHHVKHPEIPDWKIYQVNENTPELVKIQKELAAYGLKDPWARNEAWRFDVRLHGTMLSRCNFLVRGMKWGALAAFIHFGIKTLLSKDEDHH